MDIDLDDLKGKLIYHLDSTLSRLTKRPAKETADALLSWKRAHEQFNDFVSAVGSIRGRRLLEVGCGYGLFLTVCLENGIEAKGIEPSNQNYYKLTLRFGREILKRAEFNPYLIKKARGENLPYKDNSFDFVVSLFTLEHVQNIKRVLGESCRVLKQGGYLYFVVPNYGSFWESHYGIIWIPYLPKFLAKMYVKLWGKDPNLLNDLQFVSQLSLERDVQSLPLSVLDWGNKLFEERVIKFKFSQLSTAGSARRILKILKVLKLLKLVVLFANLFKAQTPIVLIAQKREGGIYEKS